MPLRVAAISFLNPAPLLYHFEHEPDARRLGDRYRVHYTSPARCAAELHAAEADLGLIPIAELSPDLAVVPGCTIASLHEVRSILLLVRHRGGFQAEALQQLRSVATDTASRSSVAYLRVLLQRFYGVDPQLIAHPADPVAMLEDRDAALLIGDPALLARERRAAIEGEVRAKSGDALLWIDIAHLWREHTHLPWVAAVWAARPDALRAGGVSAQEVISDLNASRDAGLRHVDQLVAEWQPRLPLPEATIRHYLTQNIYYHLDEACLRALQVFRSLAAGLDILPPLPELPLLRT